MSQDLGRNLNEGVLLKLLIFFEWLLFCCHFVRKMYMSYADIARALESACISEAPLKCLH